jgi:hypothetical protein
MLAKSSSRKMRLIGFLAILVAVVWFGVRLLMIVASVSGTQISGGNPMVPLVVFCFGVIMVIASFFKRKDRQSKQPN